jgi:hypothetical protein
MAGKSAIGDFAFPVLFAPVESAAGTLTFTQVQTGISINERIGWVIQRIELSLSAATIALMNATAEHMEVGISNSNSFSSTNMNDQNPQIRWMARISRTDYGTAANGFLEFFPKVYDYTQLSGGGILTLPTPIYGFILMTGGATVASANIKVYVKAIDLSDSDYFNLLQSSSLLLSS